MYVSVWYLYIEVCTNVHLLFVDISGDSEDLTELSEVLVEIAKEKDALF